MLLFQKQAHTHTETERERERERQTDRQTEDGTVSRLQRLWHNARGGSGLVEAKYSGEPHRLLWPASASP